MTDPLRMGGRKVSLKDITVPFLNVVAERDHIVPTGAAAPALDLVGSPDKGELRLDAGHIGLAVGRTAQKVTIPKIADFLRLRSRPVEESRRERGHRLGPQHADALRRFFDDLPDEDVTLLKEEVRDPAVVGGLAEGDGRARRWVTLNDEGHVGATPPCCPASACRPRRRAAARRLTRHRGQGIGRPLAQTALLAALKDGLSKVVVEVPAEEEATAQVFKRLGFEGEALLRDHIRDRTGVLRDVLVLAHFAEDTSSSLSQSGRTSRTSRRSPARAERAGSGPGAGEVRAALGEEGPDPLASVRPGGAGTDGQRLAAQRTLLPRHSDLAQQPLGGDLGGA